jgi:Dyp-type peroxidase family
VEVTAVVLSSNPVLQLDDIQGDVLVGLQKNAEFFLFFRIVDVALFKTVLRNQVVRRLTSGQRARERDRVVDYRRQQRDTTQPAWRGLNLGFTRHGMTRLLGPNRIPLDTAFERGADHPDTISALNDPAPESWLAEFTADRIDGVFLLTGPNRRFVESHAHHLLAILGSSIKPVWSAFGEVRPGKDRRHEHFGFRDNISQPGVRGLARPLQPHRAADQGWPGQDLVWPGEFVLGYPGQDPRDPNKPGPMISLPAPWARNGSFMVFRRLEQQVPEFRRFVVAQAARLGIEAELLAARMVGRWRSGAPLETAPLYDNVAIANDPNRENAFDYRSDSAQRRCPYAAHIRKVNPRDDMPGGKAEMLTHRIIRAGIPFGPEVGPGETRTAQSRGLMFVCYQASIARQFEWIQARFANNPGFVSGKKRPDSGSPVMPGYDPIVGQAPGEGVRVMDEPAPNYPAGNRRTSLEIPEEFVKLTAAAYFFMPSLSALSNVLTH